MRTAASSLCLRLLLLLIGLVLFVLCKPADGRQPATDTVTAKAADSGVKAASTAKVKKTKIHRKTRKSKPRATRRVTAKKQAANSGTIQISTPAVSVAKVSGDKDAKVAANATANTTVSAMNNATGKDRRGGTVAPTQAVPARAAALAGPAGAAGALAAAPKAGDRWIEPRTGMAFRYIPAGCFTMVLISSGALTNRINRLESAGLVKRTPDQDDRRGVNVTLTEKGLSVINDAAGHHLQAEAELLDPLNAEEQKTLAALLKKMLQTQED